MAFVRYKDVGGRRYYQVVRNYREMGRHRQEVLYHLGKHHTLGDAILAKQRKEAWLQKKAASRYQEATKLKVKILHNRTERFGNEIPSEEEARNIKKKAQELRNEALDSEDISLLFLATKVWPEQELADDILKYHSAQEFASRLTKIADEAQSEIDELLELKWKYQLA